MKKVAVVHTGAAQVEKDWANKFAGLDAVVKKQFDTVVKWGSEARRCTSLPV